MTRKSKSITDLAERIRWNDHLVKLSLLIALTAVCIADDSTRSENKTPRPTEPLTVEEHKELLPTKDNEIGAPELLKLKEAGPVVLLDVRSRESFAQRHLKGSINIQLTDLTEAALLKNIPDRTTPVVLICDYSFEPVRMIAMTLQAHPVLAAQKFTSIYRLNLWHSKGENTVTNRAEQNRLLVFEGTAVESR